MRVLTINAGSSSVRLGVYRRDGDDWSSLASVRHEGSNGDDAPLRAILAEAEVAAPDVIVHRIVHGGDKLTGSRVIDAEVEQEIERLAALAPLHNPVALQWVRRARTAFGGETPQVAVFDTAFYARLPAVAATYPLPAELSRRLGIRRFGFHGLAHQSMWRQWRRGRDGRDEGRAISLQLGAGCSITAIEDGIPRDTSMGYTPLEGLMMATRSGDVDPGVISHLQRTGAMTVEVVEEVLTQQSGLLGVSGESADLRVLLTSSRSEAHLAVDMFCYRARKYVGAYLAALGEVDAILIGGGAGEHLPEIRWRILAALEPLGVKLDPEANRAAVGEAARISTPTSPIEVRVIMVDEAVIMVEEAVNCVKR